VAEVNLAADPPQGMIFHWAGDLDGKFTVTEIWDTREANERFLEERLFPTIRKLSGREPRERERERAARGFRAPGMQLRPVQVGPARQAGS
jgi:hypothetical protein